MFEFWAYALGIILLLVLGWFATEPIRRKKK